MADSLKARLRRAANRFLHPLGLHLARRERAFEMDDLLALAARRGTAINTWIDIGASDGTWSLRARRHFPAAQFLLFEPLTERQPALAALARRHHFLTVAAAAGAIPGSIGFSVDPALDGSGVAHAGQTNPIRAVPVETVDRVVDAHRLAGPYGLKLDTHGFEWPVLAGAARTLERTNLLVIESYNFHLAPEALRFPELCTRLESLGFRCCDLADPMRRPTDGAFWQMDLAFARHDDPVFAFNRYRDPRNRTP